VYLKAVTAGILAQMAALLGASFRNEFSNVAVEAQDVRGKIPW
jgi:hypothetical protein